MSGLTNNLDAVVGDATPTTDATPPVYDGFPSTVSREFARELERRLRAAIRRLQAIQESNPEITLEDDIAYYAEPLLANANLSGA
jgi:hypothetical protein